MCDVHAMCVQCIALMHCIVLHCIVARCYALVLPGSVRRRTIEARDHGHLAVSVPNRAWRLVRCDHVHALWHGVRATEHIFHSSVGSGPGMSAGSVSNMCPNPAPRRAFPGISKYMTQYRNKRQPDANFPAFSHILIH